MRNRKEKIFFLLEEMYVVLIHCQYLKENRLNLLDNDHDLLVNYHPKRKRKFFLFFFYSIDLKY
jgi:hypothetical protein